MGNVTYVDAVVIFQLVFFIPCLLVSIYNSLKHGAMKSSRWFFLTIFCLIRIIGAAARIATIVSPNNTTADTIALVTSILGLLASLHGFAGIDLSNVSQTSAYLHGLC